MYLAQIKYQENGKSETYSFAAKECHVSVTANIAQCTIILPDVQEGLEDFASKAHVIEELVMFNEDNNVAYRSSYWNRIDGLTMSLRPDDEAYYCEVHLRHNDLVAQ